MSHDESLLVVRDGYAKARHHVLLIARDPALPDLSCVRSAHLPLLRHMRETAAAWADAHAAEVGEVRLAQLHWPNSDRALKTP